MRETSLTAFPRRVLRCCQPLSPSRPGTAVVLAYHLVDGGTRAKVDTPLAVFRSHLEWLAENTDVVPLSHIATAPEALGRFRPRVAITFDDAFANFLHKAWPELERLTLPATLYVPTGFVDGTIPTPLAGQELAPLTWSAIRDLVSSGLSVGSHSVTHRDLPRLSDLEVREELRASKERLEDRLGIPIESFCYPRALWNLRVEGIVARHYSNAVVAGGRHVVPSTPPVRIPRIPIRTEMRTLEPLFRRGIWLEEWTADWVRQRRVSVLR